MPAGKGGTADGGGESSEKNGVTRTSFRPPWVKEGPNPLPVPTMPWTLNKRSSLKDTGDESHKLVVPQLRKVQKPEPQENGTPKKDTTFVKPQLKPIPPKEQTKLQSKESLVPIKLNSVKDRELPPLPVKRDSLTEETLESIDKAMPATRNALVRQESMKRLSIPNAPPMPPPAPAMPKLIELDLSDKQKERLAMLRSRPKTRPDWTQMLKEVESGKKLKHVECNDRSQPLLPAVKAKGQFLYESEKQNAHNELLKEIQQGLKLKRVKTNDRSKPILEGLRKFRRQMTIEEQIQKSQSMASIPPEEIITDEADEMDDIDKVRDDLQSTKQLLAFELRNKEAQIRENKRLASRIQNLEAELEKAKTGGDDDEKQASTTSSEADEKIIKNLKSETEEARKISDELEKKYTQAAEDLDAKKSELDDVRKQNKELERKLQEILQGKSQSISADRKMSAPNQESEEEEEPEMSESESDGSDNEEKRERRAQREVKLFKNKLKSFKNKEDNAKKERVALKEQMKKHQRAIKEEKKKYKALQKEVDKMASLMKDSSEDEEEEEEEDEEEKEESESESESSESESETSESETDSEKSHSEPEDAPTDKIKTNLTQRTKRHENLLAALKKGNYLLKTNVERLQDDLNRQKELTTALQEDLDSVLAELG